MSADLVLDVQRGGKLVAPRERGDEVSDEHADAEALDERDEEAERREDGERLVPRDVLHGPENVEA